MTSVRSIRDADELSALLAPRIGDAGFWELRTPAGALLAWLEARPHYCDRGRWGQGIAVEPFWRSAADRGQRYYFDLEAAKSETLAYLAAKRVDVTGAVWTIGAVK